MRPAHPLAFVVLLLLASAAPARAENTDPNNDGSKYAWAENAGWINSRPSGAGGPGMQVGDTGVTGWMWSENAGWISLDCSDRGTCATTPYGVTNDLTGTLRGYAWSENLGWINFAPNGTPITIDRPTGRLVGRAWSENAGWITFSGTTPVTYGVKTSWCLPAPAAPATPSVTLTRPSPGNWRLNWSATGPAGSTYYDVVYGDVATLRSSAGNYASATLGCNAAHTTALFATVNEPVTVGKANWYLARGRNCGGASSFNDPNNGQQGSRDAGIAGSGRACP